MDTLSNTLISQVSMNKLSLLAIFASGIIALDSGSNCTTYMEGCHACKDSPERCILKEITIADHLSPQYICQCVPNVVKPESTPSPAPVPEGTSEPESTPPPAPVPEGTSEPESTPPPAPVPEGSSVVSGKCSPAYDDQKYCLCPKPKPSVTNTDKMEVSVCGDATYLLDSDVKPCSGPVSEAPAGTGCPKKGDETTLACRSEILSYMTGKKTGTCQAPEDATCEKLNTGAWGCVFPGNCNTVNTCLKQATCTAEYEMNKDGTCVTMDNGYMKPAKNNSALYDTTKLSELQQQITESDASTAFVSIIALFSGFAALML